MRDRCRPGFSRSRAADRRPDGERFPGLTIASPGREVGGPPEGQADCPRPRAGSSSRAINPRSINQRPAAGHADFSRYAVCIFELQGQDLLTLSAARRINLKLVKIF